LPRATVITAEIEPLRSEGKGYPDRHYDGVAYEFFGMGALVPDARRAVRQAADGLKEINNDT
jgi:acetyl esterase